MHKVVQINSFNGGSTGRIAKLINEKARANGWETSFFYGRSWGYTGTEEHRIATKLSVWIHFIFARLFDCVGLMSVLTTLRLIRKLRRIEPDIVHLHNIHGYYINYWLLFKYLKKDRPKVVWTLHDCWPFTGHCAHFDLAGCKKWMSYCSNCPLLKEYPQSILCDFSKYNYKLKRNLFTSISDKLYLVPVSHWMDDILEFSFLKEITSLVIHNGVDTKETFIPRDGTHLLLKYGLQNKKVLLGVASPWNIKKGLYDFKRLVNLIDKEIYAIVMVGVDEQLAKQMPEGIITIPKTHSVEELSQWYSVADMFLNLTYEDNFPTTNIEALACGTPVITYKTGGSPEAITLATGLVVSQGDMNGLVDAINRIASRGKSQYSYECRKRAISHFDKDLCFDKYIELYKNIIRL